MDFIWCLQNRDDVKPSWIVTLWYKDKKGRLYNFILNFQVAVYKYTFVWANGSKKYWNIGSSLKTPDDHNCIYFISWDLFCGPQGWPGTSLFLWREWRVQAGDLRRRNLVESCPEETTENLRLCPMSFPWTWPLLWELMGHSALLQAYLHNRQVCLLIFEWSDLKRYRLETDGDFYSLF